jgi:predicted deacylase
MQPAEPSLSSLIKGYIPGVEMADGSLVRIPIIKARGSRPGRTLVIAAAMHGWEIVGTEVIRRIFKEELDLESMQGEIVALPVANPLAYRAPAYITPQDCTDVESCVPGDPNGSQSSRIGNKLWEIIKTASCYLDLHCIEGPSIPYTIVRKSEKNELATEESLKIAKAFGLQITISTPDALRKRPNSSVLSAVSEGIPAIIPELPFPGMIMEHNSVEIGVRGVLNVMRYLHMIEGNIEPQNVDLNLDKPLYGHVIYANRGGIVHPLSKPGAKVKKGEAIARIFDVFGEDIEMVNSPKEGYIISYLISHAGIPLNQIAGEGDPICLIGYHVEGFS